VAAGRRRGHTPPALRGATRGSLTEPRRCSTVYTDTAGQRLAGVATPRRAVLARDPDRVGRPVELAGVGALVESDDAGAAPRWSSPSTDNEPASTSTRPPRRRHVVDNHHAAHDAHATTGNPPEVVPSSWQPPGPISVANDTQSVRVVVAERTACIPQRIEEPVPPGGRIVAGTDLVYDRERHPVALCRALLLRLSIQVRPHRVQRPRRVERRHQPVTKPRSVRRVTHLVRHRHKVDVLVALDPRRRADHRVIVVVHHLPGRVPVHQLTSRSPLRSCSGATIAHHPRPSDPNRQLPVDRPPDERAADDVADEDVGLLVSARSSA